MGVREKLLILLAGLAGALALWALATGGLGRNLNRPGARHSAEEREEVTQRLEPAPRPEDRWPRKEDMPWYK